MTRRRILALFASLLVMSACSSSGKHRAATETAPAADSAGTAADAYVWGSPLVITERTLQTFARLTGVNRLVWQNARSDPSSRVVVAPNVDTLYSIAVLDLHAGPMVLTLPRITDRYYVFQFIDAWTDSFAYLGTRATNARAGTWVLVPPGWKGSLPANAEPITAPTMHVFLLGRFLVKDQADIANVRALHTTVTLQPAGRAPGPNTFGAPKGTPTAVATQDATFYDELGDALASDPPVTDADRAALARFGAIGVAPGKHPFADGYVQARAALTAGVRRGEADVAGGVRAQSEPVNGWTARTDIGRYTDPLVRAVVARVGWGANVPAEAVYASSTSDAGGHAYNGNNTYVMHFAPGTLPPVRAFWSLTMYGPDHFLVTNSAHRYAISDRTPNLARNADGSLDIYVSNGPPPGHAANWLPAPRGPFSLSLRMYLPDQSVLDGTYHPPALRACSESGC